MPLFLCHRHYHFCQPACQLSAPFVFITPHPLSFITLNLVSPPGRAGEKGTAYTLVTDKDKEFAGHLVRNLEGAAQEVPKELLELAMQSSWFRKSRFKQGKAKALGGRGLGFRERPGLGSTPANEAAGKKRGRAVGTCMF